MTIQLNKLAFVALATGLMLSSSAAMAIETRITSEIKEKVKAMNLTGHDVIIDEYQGRITLSGHVGSAEEKRMVENAALATRGVDTVRNRLEIVPDARASLRSDAAYSTLQAIHSRIRANPGIKDYRVDVEVRPDGTAILSGTAGSAKEKDLITAAAMSVAGVTAVQNNIASPAPVTDSQLASRVRSALEDKEGIDLSNVEVRASNGIVSFSGVQPNHRAIDKILSIALMVPGVEDARSDMTIGSASAKLPYDRADGVVTEEEARASFRRE